MKGKIDRLLTKKECPWLNLDSSIKKNTIVYKYYGPTYGCITPSGIAVTLIENEGPFFEIPHYTFYEIKD